MGACEGFARECRWRELPHLLHQLGHSEARGELARRPAHLLEKRPPSQVNLAESLLEYTDSPNASSQPRRPRRPRRRTKCTSPTSAEGPSAQVTVLPNGEASFGAAQRTVAGLAPSLFCRSSGCTLSASKMEASSAAPSSSGWMSRVHSSSSSWAASLGRMSMILMLPIFQSEPSLGGSPT